MEEIDTCMCQRLTHECEIDTYMCHIYVTHMCDSYMRQSLKWNMGACPVPPHKPLAHSINTNHSYICENRSYICENHLQPVPAKMRLEMVIGMPNEILDGHHRSHFKRLI